MTREHAVYRFFDSEGGLLYVGSSYKITDRVVCHAQLSPWVYAATRIDIEWFPTRLEAQRAERVAIRTEDPRHNIRHREQIPGGAGSLGEHIAYEGLTIGIFSRLVGVSTCTVSRWINGHKIPSPDQQAAIAKATDGAVPVDVWRAE